MFKRFRGNKRPPQPAPINDQIASCKADLIAGRNADSAARKLGDIAIANREPNALRALWAAVRETRHLRTIVDPCAYTIGRIAIQTQGPTLVDIVFDILAQGTKTGSEPIVDKLAYTSGEI